MGYGETAERKKARIKATLEARRRAGLQGLFNINTNPPDVWYEEKPVWYQEKPGSWPGRSQDPLFHGREGTLGAKTGLKTGNMYDFQSRWQARKDRGVTEVSPQDTSPLPARIDLTPQDTSWPPVNWNLVIGFDKKGNPIYKEDTVLQSNQDDQETAEELATPTKRLWLEGENISLDKREPTTQAGTPQRGGSAVWGPGLTRERAEELHGPGGMYYQNAAQLDQALGRAPRSLMEVRRPAAQPRAQPAPTVRPNVLDRTPAALARPRVSRQRDPNSPAAILSQIDRKRRFFKGLSTLFGVKDRSAAYEARALGRYSEYMTNQALAGLTDADLDSKASLMRTLAQAGVPTQQIISILNSGIVPDRKGFVDLYNHETGDVWTGRIDSDEFVKKIKSGGWHKNAATKTTDSDLMKNRIEILKISNQERDDLRSALQEPIEKISEIQDAYAKVKATARTSPTTEEATAEMAEGMEEGLKPKEVAQGIRDIALINSYQRMIDPATVREGDVRLQRKATSWLGQFDIFKENVKRGSFLSQAQRDEMRKIADDFYKAYIHSYFPDIEAGKQFLVERYEISRLSGLDAKTAEVDFKQVLAPTKYSSWEKLYNANREYVEAMLATEEELSVEDTAVAEEEKAAELGITVDELRELRHRERLDQEVTP